MSADDVADFRGPVDVTGDDEPLERGGAVLKASASGVAWELLGKRYVDCTRSEQRMIRRIVQGRRIELEEELRGIALANSVDANHRINRTGEVMEKMRALFQKAAEDVEQLFLETDNMDAQEVEGGERKNRRGTLRQDIRHIKTVMHIGQTYVKTEALIADMHEKHKEKQAVFVKNDNRKVEITSDDVKARLGKFTVGSLGDGDGSVPDDEDVVDADECDS